MQYIFAMSIFDKASQLGIYLTIAIILTLIIIGLIIKKKSPDKLPVLGNISLGVGVGYSLGLLSIMMLIKLDEYINEGYVDFGTFLPVLAILGAIIVLAVTALIISIFKPDKIRVFGKIAFTLIAIGLAILLTIKLIQQYQSSEIDMTSELLLYLFTIIIVAIIAVITLVFGKKTTNSTKSIVYASISIAMSFALSYLRLFELPQGGSITFASMLPLMLYSYMFGIRKGLLAGCVYGILQFIQGPWFMHPIQFLLDYPIAFGAIGLTGMLKERNILESKKALQFCIGGTLAVILRYFAHVVSGIFVFGSGDPENYGAVAWSFLYNAFTFGDLAIVLVIAVGLFASRSFVRIISLNEQQ